MLGAHGDKATTREVQNQFSAILKLFFSLGEEQHCRNGFGVLGPFGAGQEDFADQRKSRSVEVGEESQLSERTAFRSARKAFWRIVWSQGKLTYGLLVFSHVVLSISTVHSDLNLLNYHPDYQFRFRVPKPHLQTRKQPQTHLLISLSSPDHVIPGKEHATDISQPFGFDRHSGGESCIERGGYVGRSVICSRILYSSKYRNQDRV